VLEDGFGVIRAHLDDAKVTLMTDVDNAYGGKLLVLVESERDSDAAGEAVDEAEWEWLGDKDIELWRLLLVTLKRYTRYAI
jgi:hypothetical protein